MIKPMIFILALCFLYYSCSTPQQQVKQDMKVRGVTVDWLQLNERSRPSIDEGSGAYYGPTNITEDEADTSQNASREQAEPIALIMGPGLYRSLALISFLKELDIDKNFNTRVVMGHGLSATIAAYYAFGFKPDYIEWKLFQFLRKTGDTEVLSTKWKKMFAKHLLDEFSDKRIEDSKLTLIVPIFNSRLKAVDYLKRGPLKEALLSNVNITDFKKNGPAFMHEFLSPHKIKALGVSKIFSLDLVSSGISWRSGSGYFNGLYQKAASHFQKVKNSEKYGVFIIYPLKQYPLDDASLVSKFIFDSQSYSKEQLKMIMDKTNI